MKNLVALCLLWLTGCTGLPANVVPVEEFELSRYLGNWFEIARLDHRFERGMSDVSAHYSLREDGGVRVINRGYSASEGQWKQAEGRAYFVDGSDVAHLKVSFFGPFYGSYIVFGLDREHYNYAFVAGPSHDYLWLLSRTPYVPDEVMRAFIDSARKAGFDTEQLIYVNHDR